MSNLVIFPLLALSIPGIILLSLGRSENPAATQTKQSMWGGPLAGIAFLYFGIACITGTRMSAQPEITGVLTALRQFNGRHRHSSEFEIAMGSQRSHVLSCPYNGSSLQEGQTVFVRYLEFDHSILHLRVLDGPNAGFTFDIPTRPWLGIVFILISLVGFWLAYRDMCKTRSSSALQSTL